MHIFWTEAEWEYIKFHLENVVNVAWFCWTRLTMLCKRELVHWSCYYLKGWQRLQEVSTLTKNTSISDFRPCQHHNNIDYGSRSRIFFFFFFYKHNFGMRIPYWFELSWYFTCKFLPLGSWIPNMIWVRLLF